MSTARSIVWSSSLTFPGQPYCVNACSAAGSNCCTGRRYLAAYRARKCAPSTGISSRRSRKGGIRTSTVFNRNRRSSRNCPAAQAAGRSAFVAESTLTFTRREREEPTRSTSPDSSTRKSLACCRSGTFPISSRKIVPPSASSKRPILSVRASVKAPLTCPKSSLSKSPSGIAPVFTATSGRDARPDRACKVWATTSLPVPCEPRFPASFAQWRKRARRKVRSQR